MFIDPGCPQGLCLTVGLSERDCMHINKSVNSVADCLAPGNQTLIEEIRGREREGDTHTQTNTHTLVLQ